MRVPMRWKGSELGSLREIRRKLKRKRKKER